MTTEYAARLAALREELKKRGLDGFAVPLTDEHASEYVADYADRLAWLTGFTGSAGSAIVLGDKAAVFVDGRYVIQVKDQVDGALYERVPIAETEPFDWLYDAIGENAKIGYDPRLHTIGWVKRLRATLTRKSGQALAQTENPIDAVWSDQAPRPKASALVHEDAHAGQSSMEKRHALGKDLQIKHDADIAVITALDSIAWLFNIRGRDVEHTPVTMAYALLRKDGSAELFIDPQKLKDDVRSHLGNEVALMPYDAFYETLASSTLAGKSVLADPQTANAAVFESLEKGGAKIVQAADPCALPKACKNAVEIEGAKQAHLRDGAAVTEFLCWLDETAPKGGLSELDCVAKLEGFRRAKGDLKDTSFDTISGSGPNGAIVHYRVTEKTNRMLQTGELYLVDSGGQYLDGTTDITRTVPIGEVGKEERVHFTYVLKGHIALSTARFPKGTTGAHLDALARRPLWDAGLDYDHGTGHGVGSFLGVHEGPQRISKAPNEIALRPGMILSNEPGYYKAGRYGIRIENLIHILEDGVSDNRQFFRFETLTLAPIDRRLVEADLLSDTERDWLNDYHMRVRTALMPYVNDQTANWLREMTEPV